MGTYLDCESSEPISIEPMQITTRMIDKKFSPQELATFDKGEMVNVAGFAKFRDGDSTRRVQITIRYDSINVGPKGSEHLCVATALMTNQS